MVVTIAHFIVVDGFSFYCVVFPEVASGKLKITFSET